MSDRDGIWKKDADGQLVTKAFCVTCDWSGNRLVHNYEQIARQHNVPVEEAIRQLRATGTFKPPAPSITEPLPGQLPPEADKDLVNKVLAEGGAQIKPPEGGSEQPKKSVLDKAKDLLGIKHS